MIQKTTLLLALLVGCGDNNKDDTGDSIAPAEEGLTFEDQNNYGYSGSLAIGNIEVQAAVDGTLDWCGLTTDIRGRAISDPAAVDQVLLANFVLDEAEILEKVEKNTLLQSDSDVQYIKVTPEKCSVKLSELEILSNYFDPAAQFVEDSSRTWLASVMNLPEGRFDILMSRFVKPTSASTDTTIVIDNDSMQLDLAADLHTNPKLSASAGDKGTFDWSAATQDVYGNPFDPLRADQLLVGKIGVATVEEAEAIFLRLDEEADELYYADVYNQTRVDLATAQSRTGTKFGGFTADGIWLLGIECTSCMSPAPLLMAVVEVN